MEKEKCTDFYKEKNKGAMNMSREYGYVRVSTKEQNEDRQLIAMHAVGLGTENIVVEKTSELQEASETIARRRYSLCEEHRQTGKKL